jgi:hypothetical protein
VIGETGLRSSTPSAASLEPLIAAIKDDLADGVRRAVCTDLAFIGNMSEVYAWTPCFMVDFDAFIFSDALDERLGTWLLDRGAHWRAELAQHGIDFELRIIEGPYKPAIKALERPVIVLHLGVFTEQDYLAIAPLKRWAWRKYACLSEPARLARLAPERPNVAALLSGPRGVEYRLRAIASGCVPMREWVLPSFREQELLVRLDDPNFVECCFAYALSSARAHGRVLGFGEADSLPNEKYFCWYANHLLSSADLLHLLEMKIRCRNSGFAVDTAEAQRLALGYLNALSNSLATTA